MQQRGQERLGGFPVCEPPVRRWSGSGGGSGGAPPLGPLSVHTQSLERRRPRISSHSHPAGDPPATRGSRASPRIPASPVYRWAGPEPEVDPYEPPPKPVQKVFYVDNSQAQVRRRQTPTSLDRTVTSPPGPGPEDRYIIELPVQADTLPRPHRPSSAPGVRHHVTTLDRQVNQLGGSPQHSPVEQPRYGYSSHLTIPTKHNAVSPSNHHFTSTSAHTMTSPIVQHPPSPVTSHVTGHMLQVPGGQVAPPPPFPAPLLDQTAQWRQFHEDMERMRLDLERSLGHPPPAIPPPALPPPGEFPPFPAPGAPFLSHDRKPGFAPLASPDTAIPAPQSAVLGRLPAPHTGTADYIKPVGVGGTRKKFQVEFDVKGYEPENIEVKTDGSNLEVRGRGHYEGQTGDGVYVQSSTQFTNMMSIPDNVKTRSLNARLEPDRGTLTLEAPVKDPRRANARVKFADDN